MRTGLLSAPGLIRRRKNDVGPPAQFTRWSTVPVGAGGFVTHIAFSGDGLTRICGADGNGGTGRWDPTAASPALSPGRWVLNNTTDCFPAGEPANVGGPTAITVAKTDSRVAFMAMKDVLYRSRDGARTWYPVLAGILSEGNVDYFKRTGSRLEVDPRDPKTVFYGTMLNGLQVSRDQGDTWTQVPANNLPFGLQVDVTDPTQAGTLDGSSTVTGNIAAGGISAVAFDAAGPVRSGRCAVIYTASYGNGIYRSLDGGATWTKISPPTVRAVHFMVVLSDRSLIATTQSDPVNQNEICTIYRYSPTDDTWTATTVPTGGKNPRTWHSMAEDPFTPGRVSMIATSASYAQSNDYGRTWNITGSRTLLSDDDIPWQATSIASMTAGQLFYDPVVPYRIWMGEGTGVWYSDLGAAPIPADNSGVTTWHSQSRGLEQLVPYVVSVPPAGPINTGSWDRPIFTIPTTGPNAGKYPTTYGPTTTFNDCTSLDWSLTDPMFRVAAVTSHNSPYSPVSSGWSPDGGVTWTPFATIPLNSTNGKTTFGYGTIAVSTPDNIVWAPANGKRIHYTLNRGVTWVAINNLPGLVTNADYGKVNSRDYFVYHRPLIADKTVPGKFYLYVATFGTFVTTDGGVTWTQTGTKLSAVDYSFDSHLKCTPDRSNHLWLSGGGFSPPAGPWKRSTDAGATWTDVAGFTNVTAYGFGAAFPGQTYPAIYVFGYYNGVRGFYRSIDNAATWTLLTTRPGGRFAGARDIDGDKTVPGRFYVALGGGAGWVRGEPSFTNSAA